jgi:hypothetical protein
MILLTNLISFVKLKKKYRRALNMLSKCDWEKPELIILTRGNPEEVVLAYCKYRTGDNELGKNNSCNIEEGEDDTHQWCNSCHGMSPS